MYFHFVQIMATPFMESDKINRSRWYTNLIEDLEDNLIVLVQFREGSLHNTMWFEQSILNLLIRV
jgi:hypothetical protein